MINYSGTTNKRERTRLLELANEYKAKGYDVTIEPNKNQRPDFLDKFQPDLIAISSADKVIVEVKSKLSLKQSGYLESLARVIEQHKEWRFELVLTNPREQYDFPNKWALLPVSDLEKRLTETKYIFENLHQNENAMLLLWVIAEATLLHVARRESVNLVRQSPKIMVKELFSLGIINGQEFETLNQAADVRNKIVHGYTTNAPLDDIFSSTEKLVYGMISTLTEKSKKE